MSSIDARIVIGSLIIKHKLKLDDREVVETIRENMYLQYFLGLSCYQSEPLFDRSLFTAFRYRLGADQFDEMSQALITKAFGIASEAEKAATAAKQPPAAVEPGQEPELPAASRPPGEEAAPAADADGQVASSSTPR